MVNKSIKNRIHNPYGHYSKCSTHVIASYIRTQQLYMSVLFQYTAVYIISFNIRPIELCEDLL